MKENFKSKIFFIIVTFLSVSNSLFGEQFRRCYESVGSNGAVSCGHPLAAKTAIEILKEGGNAVDAAVSAAFVLGVVDFTNSGIGGEGFALVREPYGKIIAIDGSSRRPNKDIKLEYECQISLPTIPEMLLKMGRLYGSIDREKLLKPAIELCEQGFELSPYLSKILDNKLNKIKDKPALALIAPKGVVLKTGDMLRQPLLAQTLKSLSQDQGLSFYFGEEADKTIADMNLKGSAYDKYDFMSYKSRLCKPVKLDYKEYSIYGNPFPSSSAIAIKLALDLANSKQPLSRQNHVEKLYQMMLFRKHLDIKHYIAAKEYNDSQGFMESNKASLSKPSKDANDSNTTHLCVWDKNGMVVSMTLTLGSHLGTGQLSPGGFFYANCLRTYSERIVSYPSDYPVKAGSITSKSPIIVTKNTKPWLAIGGAGSDRIITNTALMVAQLLRGYSLEESMNTPRFFMEYNNQIYLEKSINNQSWQENTLNRIRHIYPSASYKDYLDDYFGLISAIQVIDEDKIKAVGDRHRDGCCLTY